MADTDVVLGFVLEKGSLVVGNDFFDERNRPADPLDTAGAGAHAPFQGGGVEIGNANSGPVPLPDRVRLSLEHLHGFDFSLQVAQGGELNRVVDPNGSVEACSRQHGAHALDWEAVVDGEIKISVVASTIGIVVVIVAFECEVSSGCRHGLFQEIDQFVDIYGLLFDEIVHRRSATGTCIRSRISDSSSSSVCGSCSFVCTATAPSSHHHLFSSPDSAAGRNANHGNRIGIGKLLRLPQPFPHPCLGLLQSFPAFGLGEHVDFVKGDHQVGGGQFRQDEALGRLRLPSLVGIDHQQDHVDDLGTADYGSNQRCVAGAIHECHL
mmetsp:Transcript_18401/g.40068  ORF Transcript_18401/g.40068 Transcript_18401/m.40068 type:complete len:323 (+) Transcript_18401:817-1785(+)